jgi:hypothetical protein
MSNSSLRLVVLAALVTTGCAPQNIEPASPVQAATRALDVGSGFSDSYTRRADDGIVVAKVVSPVPLVWQAVLAALTARNITPSVFDRPAGRMGDTALMMSRSWNRKPVSRYFSCGSTMTGPRADQDRIKSILLVQLTRLKEDTIAVAVHLSGTATAMASGNSTTQASCLSSGEAETDMLDDVLRQLGVRRRF